jgi:hypothetical protein
VSDDFADELAALHELDAGTMVGNHLFVLIQLAAARLTEAPPRPSDASLLIDVAGAIVAAGGERLGANLELYRQALAEVQQLYVRATSGN